MTLMNINGYPWIGASFYEIRNLICKAISKEKYT